MLAMTTQAWKGIVMGVLLIALSACTGTTEYVDSISIKEENPSGAIPREKVEATGNSDTIAVNRLAETGKAKGQKVSAVHIVRGGETYTMYDYLWRITEDIDVFWTDIWKKTYEYEPVVYVSFPEPGEQVPIKCGIGYSDDSTSLYCPEDDQLVISQAFAQEVLEGKIVTNPDPVLPYKTGDFSIAFYVAHEYAHSLQEESGLLAENMGKAVRNLELHADCFAGVWAKSVYNRGLLETGDLEEVMRTSHDGGDYSDDPALHHGTPEQRYAAFKTGYDSGASGSCDRYVQGEIE